MRRGGVLLRNRLAEFSLADGRTALTVQGRQNAFFKKTQERRNFLSFHSRRTRVEVWNQAGGRDKNSISAGKKHRFCTNLTCALSFVLFSPCFPTSRLPEIKRADGRDKKLNFCRKKAQFLHESHVCSFFGFIFPLFSNFKTVWNHTDGGTRSLTKT